jgi:phage terminase Nu1 subunit (DNA packaging protein)
MAKFVSAKQLAEALGITERRVNQITKEKDIFPRDLNGKFALVQCIENYYRDKFEIESPSAELDREKVRHERAKREKTELQLAKMRNELFEASVVEHFLTNMVVTFRNRILGVPTKLAPIIIGQKNISIISNIIEKELRSTLAELSEYDASMFIDEEVFDDEDETEEENIQSNN